PAVSPDGRRIAFVANSNGKDKLWMRDLDTLSTRALAETEGADHPFWSPDGRYLAFFAGGRLKKIEVAGGPPVTIGDASGVARGGSWGSRDVIVFAPSPISGLFKIPAAGGNATLVKKVGRFPWFLPDGRHFLYGVGPQSAVYLADLDSDVEER